MYNPAGFVNSFVVRSGFFSILCLFTLLGIHPLSSQQLIQTTILIDLVHDTKAVANVSDSFQLHVKIEQWIRDQRKEGYLLAGMDSMRSDSNARRIYLHKGGLFHYVMMEQDSITNTELKKLHLDVPDHLNSSPEYWTSQFTNWIHVSSTRAHPFARIDVAPIRINSDSLIAQYEYRSGQEIVFHQIDQRQKKIIDDQVLSRMLGIIPGEPYNQNLVEGIQEKLGRLSYVQMKSSPRILFLGNEGIVWLYLEKSRASKFDILLGLSPETGLSNKKYQLTGEAGFELFNSVKYGERIFFKYENLIENSPKLKLGFEFPYVKHIPFGLSTDFHLYRFGEQYIDLSSQLIITYPWSLLQHSGVSFTYLASTVLNPDSLFLSRSQRLPSQLDYSYTAIGLRHEYIDLDYKPNPTIGWAALLDVKVGTKTFKPNSILLSYESDQIHVKRQYDSLNLNKEQAVYSFAISKYINFKSRNVFKFAIAANGIFTSGKIVDNELIKIGGYKNLRGFDEDFYKCSHAAIQTFEYRFLLDRNSFLNVFSDYAYLKQPVGDQFEWNWYEGFGLGIQFQTKVGAFSLQYAMGTSKLQAVDFGKGKIHFGYSTLF